MIGRYLGEFSLSYKPTRHGKAGVGATKGSAHTSLKWFVLYSNLSFYSICLINSYFHKFQFIIKLNLFIYVKVYC